MPTVDPRLLAELHARLEDWATLWRVPLLAKEVRIRTSGRLRRALGTYRASTAQITLATWLLEPPHRGLLEEVLCHEAAHAAVHLSSAEVPPAPPDEPEPSTFLSRLRPRWRVRAKSSPRAGSRAGSRAASRRRARPRPRPHGPEWRAFMEAAGHAARVRFPDALMPPSVRAAIAASRCWEHRCPVCDMTRMARTRVTRWRCRRCVEAGRSGRLRIVKRSPV